MTSILTGTGAADSPPPLQGAPWCAPQGAHQVAFNLDDLANAPAPNDVAFGHDPGAPNPAAAW